MRNPVIACFMSIVMCSAVLPALAQGQNGPLHPPDLLSLAKEFREWRSAQSGDVPNFAKRVEEQKKGLEKFARRLESLNTDGWPVHAKVDYLVLLVEMNDLHFELNVVRQVSRNPNFFVNEAIRRVTRHIGGRYQMGPGVPVPYDAKRSAAIVKAIQQTKATVEQAPKALTEAVPEMADMAIERLKDVGKYYDEFAQVIGQHIPEPYRSQIGPAAEEAGVALEEYRNWLQANRPNMKAPLAIGREAFDWNVQNVLVMPYDGESLLTQAETERHRNWAYLQFERQRNRRLPGYEGPGYGGKKEPLPVAPVKTFERYSELKDATDVLSRLWAKEHDLVTHPDYLGPMRVKPGGVFIGVDRGLFGFFGFPTEATPPGTKTEFMVEPDHWFAHVYQEFAKWMDPGINHPHSDYPGHTFESAVSRRTTCELRRGHSTRGDAWTFYMEDVMLQLDYPFVRGPRVREWIYGIMLWRVERIVVGVKLADGSMTPKEAEEHLVDRVPWMDSFKGKRMDVWNSLARPGFTLKYQAGKFEVLKLLMDRMRQLGDEFNLREFHDALFATGRIPVSLARWEMAGIDDDVKHLWERRPLPLATTTALPE